jgi:hypothetical protein
MYTDAQTIKRHRLDRLKQDLETLTAAGAADVGKQKIIEEIRPLVSAAERRGCSASSIAALLQSYGLSLSSSELGLTRQL